MTTSLIPQAFWFRLAIPAPRRDDSARPSAREGPLDLSESCVAPDLSLLENGPPSWAKVGVAWNPKGIWIHVRADEANVSRSVENHPDGLAAVQIWIDTRDSRNVSRATRFCHRFTARLTPRGGKAVEVEAAQRPIPRATADAPISRPDLLAATAGIDRNGWWLDWFIPAEALHGYDPETNRRLGFAYQITAPLRDDLFLAAGREFPVGENPSLWSTLELIG